LKALKSKGIPHRFSGNQGLYSREEIRILIAFLNTITDFNDSMSLYHLSCSEIYQLNAKDLIPCHSISRGSHKPLYYVMKEISEFGVKNPVNQKTGQQTPISEEGLATIKRLIQDIEKYSEMAMEETTGRVIYSFLMDTGYITGLSQKNSADAVEKVQNIAKFFELAQHIENTLSIKKVAVFADYLDLLLEAGDNPGAAEPDIEADWVQVLTVHKAKGLEFPVVFMVSLVADRFPRKERSDQIELPDALIKDILPSGDFHLQEERRLFYVGMTRAMNKLYLTSASDYGGVRAKKISPFVLEALDMPKAEFAAVKTKPMEAIKRYASVKEMTNEFPAMPDDTVLSLSHYQIDDYRTCPLKYKYVHILKVPLLPHHS
ncbi:MAG: ATP-dependent helicase, partial [Deltaproteobacteria bacterium]